MGRKFSTEEFGLKVVTTVGENAADIGSVAIAYDAFKLTKKGAGTSKLGDSRPDQRFVISIARIWRVKMKKCIRAFVDQQQPTLTAHRASQPP
jgi:predicted metalloendopeptidase